MKLLRKITSDVNFFRRKGMLDVIVVFGFFVTASVLVLGLFPRGSGDSGRVLYLYTMMSIPIIIAVYFILVSFRRTVARVSHADSNLRTKITLVFIFITIVPLVPVVIISNSVVKQALESSGYGETGAALRKAIELSKNEVSSIAYEVRKEIEQVEYALNKGIISIDTTAGRRTLAGMLKVKGYYFQCYKLRSKGNVRNEIEPLYVAEGDKKFSDGVAKYLSLYDFGESRVVSHLSIESSPVIVGIIERNSMAIVVYRSVQGELFSSMRTFSQSLDRYNERAAEREKARAMASLLLLLVSIIMIVISVTVSLYFSKMVTLPMLEIADAAKSVAGGNFDVSLSRESNDEIKILYQSFNTMTRQLKQSRDAMYIAQKLNAWREVSKKILHEIKNPLTPIRLSAERIRRRFSENDVNIESVVQKGTGTIIEEVGAIQRILDEFTTFARMPEVKPEPNDLSLAIKGYAGFYHGHEKIKFVLKLDEKLPPVRFDKLLLRNAVSNLVKNAIEAMDGEGIIEITTGKVDASTAFVSIGDKGHGISPEDIELLFEPTFSRKEKGTGLGLAIVEKIALDHKGKVYCSSKVGEGSVFTIELPLA